MRQYWRAAAFTVAAICLNMAAWSQSGGLPCDAFQKNPDGSWSAVRNISVPGAGKYLNVQQGAQFPPGRVIMGLDLGTQLDQACPAEAAAGTAPPQVELPKLADPVSGFIDSDKLTCGQLASIYQEDADFLLTWYSGLHSGQAKKRMIDVTKVKAGIHNVIVYCKANKDKPVAQAIDLIMK